MPSSNRFQKVHAADTKKVTVTIWSQDGLPRGEVAGPIVVAGGEIRTAISGQDGSVSALTALSQAVALANKLGVKIVVVDHDNTWNSEWGTLE